MPKQYILRHIFSLAANKFRRMTPEEYADSRRNADRPIKERPDYKEPKGENVTSYASGEHEYQFSLADGQVAKILGYSVDDENTNDSGNNASAQSTGTSRPEIPCLTTGIGPCITVAIGGEKFKDGKREPGAKIRLFHIFPHNKDVIEDMRDYVAKLREEGLTIKAAIHGGDKATKPTLVENVRKLFHREFATKVKIEFDRMYPYSTPETRKNLWFGAVITQEHEVKFITELVKRREIHQAKPTTTESAALPAITDSSIELPQAPASSTSPAEPLAEETFAKWRKLTTDRLKEINNLTKAKKQPNFRDGPLAPILVAAENHRQKDLKLSTFDNVPDFGQYLLKLQEEVPDGAALSKRAMVALNDRDHYGAFDIRIEKKNGKPKITIVCICPMDGTIVVNGLRKHLRNFPIEVSTMVVATRVQTSPPGCPIFAKSFASKLLKHQDNISELHQQLAGETDIQRVTGAHVGLPPDFYKHSQTRGIRDRVEGYSTTSVSNGKSETLEQRDAKLRANRLVPCKGKMEVNISLEDRRRLDYVRGDSLLDVLEPEPEGKKSLIELLNAAAPNRKIGWDQHFLQTKRLMGEQWDSQDGLEPLANGMGWDRSWLGENAENPLTVAKELIEATPMLQWPSLQKNALFVLGCLIDEIKEPSLLAEILATIPNDLFAKVLPNPPSAIQSELIPDAFKIYQKKSENSTEQDQQRLQAAMPETLRVYSALQESLTQDDSKDLPQVMAQLDQLKQLDRMGIWPPSDVLNEALTNVVKALHLAEIDKPSTIRLVLDLLPHVRDEDKGPLLTSSLQYLQAPEATNLGDEGKKLIDQVNKAEHSASYDYCPSVDEANIEWDILKSADRLYNLQKLWQGDRNDLWQARSPADHAALWQELKPTEKVSLLTLLSENDRSDLWQRESGIDDYQLWKGLNPKEKLGLLTVLSDNDRSELWQDRLQIEQTELWEGLGPSGKLNLLTILSDNDRKAFLQRRPETESNTLMNELSAKDKVQLSNLLFTTNFGDVSSNLTEGIESEVDWSSKLNVASVHGPQFSRTSVELPGSDVASGSRPRMLGGSQMSLLRSPADDEDSANDEISNQEIISLVNESGGNVARGSCRIDKFIRSGGHLHPHAMGFTIRQAGEGKQEVLILHHQEQSTTGHPNVDVYTALTFRQAKYIGLYSEFGKQMQIRQGRGALPLPTRRNSINVPADSPKLYIPILTELRNVMGTCCCRRS